MPSCMTGEGNSDTKTQPDSVEMVGCASYYIGVTAVEIYATRLVARY